MSKANKMGFEEIRSRMKKEVKSHRNGTAPKDIHSTNRLNAMVTAAEANFGRKASTELYREFTSKRR